jgi:hypothetical protein
VLVVVFPTLEFLVAERNPDDLHRTPLKWVLIWSAILSAALLFASVWFAAIANRFPDISGSERKIKGD